MKASQTQMRLKSPLPLLGPMQGRDLLHSRLVLIETTMQYQLCTSLINAPTATAHVHALGCQQGGG